MPCMTSSLLYSVYLQVERAESDSNTALFSKLEMMHQSTLCTIKIHKLRLEIAASMR